MSLSSVACVVVRHIMTIGLTCIAGSNTFAAQSHPALNMQRDSVSILMNVASSSFTMSVSTCEKGASEDPGTHRVMCGDFTRTGDHIELTMECCAFNDTGRIRFRELTMPVTFSALFQPDFTNGGAQLVMQGDADAPVVLVGVSSNEESTLHSCRTTGWRPKPSASIHNQDVSGLFPNY